MYLYFKVAVLVFALSLASMELAAGKNGSASTAASSSTKRAGSSASGSSAASTSSGSTTRAGSGMHGIFRPAPELDPKRKISEQDCTKPIVHDTGNLRCK